MWYLVHSLAVDRFFVLDKDSLMKKRHILQLQLLEASEDYQYLLKASEDLVNANMCLN